jgi:hypothetical protein
MYSNSEIKFYWFAAIFGCGLMLISLGSTSAQQPLRPELILDVGAPEEVNAQPNFVMAQPHAPFAIPFRSTMGDSAYAAAKQRANSAYAPGVTKAFPLAPTVLGPPVIKTNNFNGHSETEGLFPPDTHGAIGVNHFVEVTNSHFDVFSKASPPALVKSVTLATFFNYTAETLFDPPKYTATNTSHASSTRLVQSTVTVPSYGVPPDAHQSGTSQVLDTSDSRFVNASTQNGTDLWQTHTIAFGPYPAPKFYRLNTSTNAVRQSGFYFASHTSDDFNASITANAAGNCFVTWTSTDASIGVNAQVRLSGKLSADAQITAGTAGFTSPTFLTGNFDPRLGTQRWGDYSAVTLDPSNGANGWLVNEKINNNSILGSRIITIGF